MTELTPRALRSDAERNRLLILETAADAFAEWPRCRHGRHRPPRRGRERHGLRRFPTKDALVEAIFEEKIAELLAAAARAAEIEDPWDALVELAGGDGQAPGTRPRLLPGDRAVHARPPGDGAPPTGRPSPRSTRSSSAPYAARRRHHPRRHGPRQGCGVVPAAVAGSARGRVAPLPGAAARPEAATPLPGSPLTFEEIERALGAS